MNTTKLLKTTLAVALLASGSTFAAGPTSGQLVIINSLANLTTTSTGAGSSASAFSVVVSDASGPCSTTATVAYNGSVTVKWNASATHSTTVCTGITSVAVTPLKTTVGTTSTIIYDATTSTLPLTTATGATTFTAPTTAYTNMLLIVNGNGTPSAAVTASATAWGVGAAQVPTFDLYNGSAATSGIPGAVGTYGLKAERMMRAYAIRPLTATTK